MKRARYGDPGSERPAVLLDDGTRLDASGQVRDYDEAFFAGDAIDDLRRWVAADPAAAPRIPAGARIACPIARPSKIVCIGLNFRDHAAESAMDLPKEPVIFFKASSAIAGPNDPVRIPRGGTKLDWEVELAIVIGRAASYVEERDALAHVAGYALHNDYSERSFQLERGGQWVKGKSADTFAPIGPFLATPDEIPDPQSLDMWLTVHGQTRQRGSTRDMVFGVATLVSYVSQFMTLLPGDVISTGTPAGVALGMKPEPVFLRAGDVVELGIDRLGRSRQQVVAPL